MKLSELGERRVVRDILRLLGVGPTGEGRGHRRSHARPSGVVFGAPGDDCAFIEWGGAFLLATSDVVSPRTHVPMEAPWIWGWHAAAVNLSDIAAKGGEPLGVLMSLLLPPGTKENVALEIMRGARDCCARFGTVILGGDTKEGAEVAISGTAIGRVPRGMLMPRGGARPGDLLAVTGVLGEAAVGYLFLRGDTGRGVPATDLAGGGDVGARGAESTGDVVATGGAKEIRRILGSRFGSGWLKRLRLSRASRGPSSLKEQALLRFLAPVPRLEEGRAAARTRKVHACTDISDGLSASVHQLCEASGTGAVIELERLPVAPVLYKICLGRASGCHSGKSAGSRARQTTRRLRFSLTMSPEELALNFGGDYELLMALPPGEWERVRRAILRTGTQITMVGKVTGGRRVLLLDRGRVRPMGYGGWEHFVTRVE
ncbi:MAG: thiamine-phosphate kinase [Thermoplasmata archaeon]